MKKVDLEIIEKVKRNDSIRFINFYKVHSIAPIYKQEFWKNFWKANNMNTAEYLKKGNKIDLYV